MSALFRELAVFPIVLGPALPFYLWQWRTVCRKYPKPDRTETMT